MIDLDKILESVIEIAKDVGTFIINEQVSFDIQNVEIKGKNDLVSYVDKEAEKIIVSKLKALIAGAGFITEENTINETSDQYNWIIDPLDGTTNFIHGLPLYSVSIALAKHGEILLGVVYEINKGECFYTHKHIKSYCNGGIIKVSEAKRIADSLFATGFPIHNFSKRDHYLAILNELMENAHGLRRLGSAAVDLAYVAAGRYEAYFEYNLNPWDVAAGAIVVKNAGGKVSDFRGGDNYLYGREIVASNHIHDDLLALINRYW